jgi:hypothetical protein
VRTTEIYGAGVRVGTVIVFLGRTYTVTSVEGYQHPSGRRGRIAHSGPDWRMTVFNDDLVEVADLEAEAVPV